MDETLTRLENQGIEVPIVVAIDNGGANRINEYSPYVNAQYGGGEGDEYLDFIVETLKPRIDEEFRTLQGPENTGIMGSSMGGLISHYAYTRHPEVFGRVGIFSPAYWFSDEYFSNAINQGKVGNPRLYFLAGGLEGQNLAQTMQDMYDTLLLNGFSEEDMQISIEPDGEHSEWFWAREFQEAILWLFQEQAVVAGLPDELEGIQFFPNPTKDTLKISGSGRFVVRVFDNQGKVITKKRIRGTGEINLENSNQGVFIVEVEQKGRKRSFRVVKE